MTPEPPTRTRKASSVIMVVALVDCLLVVPYSYWRLHGLDRIIATALEGIGVLTLLGMALYFRRRGL